MSTQVGIFAKHWTPGRVKTRLAASVGDEAAAAIARAFVETLLVRLDGAAEQAVVGFAPAEAKNAFEEVAPAGWRLVPQCEGDLGQRMRHYFEDAFANGADRVVLLGADSPNVPLERVETALERLHTQQLVLGPTDDGGYYLIGARGEPPPVFDCMPWSSDNLWQATTSRLDELGWRAGREWGPLPAWYDVDTIDDLERLRADLAANPGDAALRRLAARLAGL